MEVDMVCCDIRRGNMPKKNRQSTLEIKISNRSDLIFTQGSRVKHRSQRGPLGQDRGHVQRVHRR